MLKNYLRIAWRNITRNKPYSLVNILGLALALCACMVIYLVTSYELSFDRFHPRQDRIYRVLSEVTESTGDKLQFGKAPVVLQGMVRGTVRGIETISTIVPYNAAITVKDKGADARFESRLPGTSFITTVVAEPEYFSIFSYKWLAGDRLTALQHPYTVVLTANRARQYFGNSQPGDIIGKEIIYDDSLSVRVSGIIEDWNKNSDLLFTDFISFNTIQTSFLNARINTVSWKQDGLNAWVFALLGNDVKPEQINSQLKSIVRTHSGETNTLGLKLEPLSSLHFNSDIIENPVRTAHKPTLYTLMAIGLFILALAIINFINLATAISITREKEIGVRKVLGSGKRRLVLQFITETLILTIVAAVLALTLVNPVVRLFSNFIPAGIWLDPLQLPVVLFISGTIIVTTLAAGFYPAIVLSSLMPLQNMRVATHRNGDNWMLRKALIVFQFAVSLVFIIGSMIMTSQLRYTTSKDKGFLASNVLLVDGPRGEDPGKIKLLAEKFRHVAGVSNVTMQWLAPMTDNPRGMKLKYNSSDQKDFWVAQVAGDQEYIPLYNIKLVAGRNLVRTDSVNEFVINESLASMMGSNTPSDAIGKTLYWNDKPYPVVGVVADFHTASLHEPISPLCIINRPEREGSLGVKLSSNPASVLVSMAQLWKEVYPNTGFAYKFYDESLRSLYEKDRQTASLMYSAMVVAIVISCIGLFGLALFSSKKRAKEISIRKLLGAGITNIVALLTREMVVLAMISLVIASPVAWYIMNGWLGGFAYRVAITPLFFIVSGAGLVLIALLTISYQSIKAAIVNPVEGLRNN